MDKVTPLSIKELGLEDSEVLKGSLAIEEFLSLANRLISLSMYKEAIFLYELACKLNPENIALKINLSRIRELKKKADLSKIKELEEEIGRKRMKDDIVANHYIGLGYLHYRKGDIDKARDFFEMAKSRNKNFFIASLFLGKIHMGNNDIENAVAELEQARRANPFSEEVQSLLGKLYMEKGESQKSLEAYIDALILSGDPDLAKHPLYNQNIKNIFASLPDKGAKDVQAYIKERTQKFMDAAEVLERKKQEYMEGVKSQKLQSIFATHWEQ
jgi:tetratricopeptide (TPR) repeat protein